jgi:hypothetical protein
MGGREEGRKEEKKKGGRKEGRKEEKGRGTCYQTSYWLFPVT